MGFRSIRRLLWQKDGSVSIFAVIVLSSLLLFFSVLIDFARIAALHHMAENGSKSAIRSVLSAYDSQLYGLYGLFGRGGTEGRQIFATVLEENISGNARGSSEGFNLVASRLIQLSFTLHLF